MNNKDNSKYQENKRYTVSLKSIFAVLKDKVNDKTSAVFHKLHFISLNRSHEVTALRCNQIRKKLSKLFTLKMRIYWTTLTNNITQILLQKRQKITASLKVKDRVYEAKVKSLRVLSRQWKQKKSQSEYKNKFFTPKLEQTPKMIKQKVSQQFYLTLRNILRNKYLLAFNGIKSSLVIRIRNSKGLYLANYLISKRRYWLMFGYERLRLNVLVDREAKSKEQIQSLDARLVAVEDSEVIILKEKQEKLQTALNSVIKQKQHVSQQVDKQTGEMSQKTQQKHNQIIQLQQQKKSLLNQLQLRRQQTSNWEFSREEIFYYIYTNFLINLKLWAVIEPFDQDNIFLNKALVLEWLQCPVMDFDLEKVRIEQSGQLDGVIENLSGVVKEYKRLRSNELLVDWNGLFQQYFSGYSANQCNNFEEMFNKIKFTSKMLEEMLHQNAQIVNNLLQSVQDSYHKLTQNQSFEVLEY